MKNLRLCRPRSGTLHAGGSWSRRRNSAAPATPLAAERRRMPWMAVDKEYWFEGPAGRLKPRHVFEAQAGRTTRRRPRPPRPCGDSRPCRHHDSVSSVHRCWTIHSCLTSWPRDRHPSGAVPAAHADAGGQTADFPKMFAKTCTWSRHTAEQAAAHVCARKRLALTDSRHRYASSGLRDEQTRARPKAASDTAGPSGYEPGRATRLLHPAPGPRSRGVRS